MPLFTLGLNYESAPLSVRERVAFAADALVPALRDLKSAAGVDEAAIVSTCNRTEIMGVGGEQAGVRDWLCDHHRVAERELRDHLYAYGERDTVRHAFRVASGLDSMVLGEPQILGQMKQAYRTAEDACTAGPVLSRLFQQAFRVAKQVRTETAIGARPVSVAAAAARLTSEIFDGLSGKAMLLVGAGDTARLVAQHLHRLGPPRLTIANRSAGRAQALARRYGGAVCGLEALPGQLAAADLVVCAVGGGDMLIDAEMAAAAFAQRRRKPVLMIDLAVPRSIDPQLAENPDVYLYAVDDLQALTENSRVARAVAAADAEILVDNGTDEFMQWLAARDSAATINQLRSEAHAEAARLVEAARRRLAAGDDPEAVLATLAQRLTNRLLHGPSRAINEAQPGEREQLAALIERLFRFGERQ